MNRYIIIFFLFIHISGFTQEVLHFTKGARIAWVNAGEVPPTPPFNPGDLGSDLVAWYDLTDGTSVIRTGSVIDTLKDKSATLRHLTQTFNAKPNYSTSGGANNLPYMTIDSAHTIYDDIQTYSGAGTIAYCAVRLKHLTPLLVSGSYRKVIVSYFAQSAGWFIDSLAPGYIPIMYWNGNRNFTVYKNSATTDWQVVSFEFSPDTTLYQTNSQPISINCKFELTGIGPTRMQFGYFSFTQAAEISELVICDYSITEAQRDSVKAYLMRKYEPQEQPYMLTWGNSLTAGNCDYVTNWSYQVSDSIDVPLVNMATGGTIVEPNNGSTGVAGRNFINIYQLGLVPNRPVWMTVMFGVNDTNQGGINAAWKTKYKAILQQFLDDGYNADSIILCIPPSISTRQALMAQTNTYISEIASEMGLRLYDANAYFIANGGDSNWSPGDDLHPNVAGNINFRNGIIAVMYP